MRRIARIGLAAAALLAIVIAVAPAFLRPTGNRLAIVQNPSDYGLA